MGKKKDRKGKLPKRIAGVKLPKAARLQAERMIVELRQPIVREMIAGAVSMAANAMARQATAAPNAPASKADAEPETTSAGRAKSGGQQFADFATGVGLVVLGKLFEKVQSTGETTTAPKV